ncbi:VasL domain-containing protein [Rouxiella sp. Mn2063]|uniref:VasL domain-containing protein n=1 Tax=Rouxiella sp. Mn2063 TaxID=3395262 RepID=UPI003BE0BA60
MTTDTERVLKTGGDPRALADFAALRDELSKLSHPARPDVDWKRVEQLSLSLFRQNGVELQTASWYTLSRTYQAGMYGLNEGLGILNALITHQWGALWPQPVHARMEILAGLSQRLQTMLRTLSLRYNDLSLIYQAEQHLNGIRDVLQRLELKNASQIGDLCTFMHNAATRLENADARGSDDIAVVLTPISGTQPNVQPSLAPAGTSQPLVYVARQEPTAPRVVTTQPEKPKRQWKGFIAGVLTSLVVGGASCWGMQVWLQPTHPLKTLPVLANELSLNQLQQLPPLWLQEYGFALVAQAQPPEAAALTKQWQQYIAANALPMKSLSGWHQGMAELQELTQRLNALDSRKGKYMTGSELKSMVFSITQAMSRSVPLEEQLYLLSEQTSDTPLPAALVAQTDMHLNQLLNRYILIKQQAGQPRK